MRRGDHGTDTVLEHAGRQARLPIAITHSRAHLVVTNRPSHQFQVGIE